MGERKSGVRVNSLGALGVSDAGSVMRYYTSSDSSARSRSAPLTRRDLAPDT